MNMYLVTIHATCTTTIGNEPMTIKHKFDGLNKSKIKALRLAEKRLTKWADNPYIESFDIDDITVKEM